MIARPFLIASIFSLVPALAFAQAKETAPAEGGEKKDAPAAPSQPTTPQERFQIKRGFFAESDLGVYMTFGGRNTNNPMLPSRATSNIQPHLGVVLGYDIVHGDSFDFSLGLRFAMGLSGGAGRVNTADLMTEEVTTKSNDFTVIETGAQVGLSFLTTDRLAVTVKLDGGMGIVDPDTSKTAGEMGAGSAAFAPTFGAGVGIELFTLLSDFSVGLTLRFQAVLLDGMIPGATITAPIKYTF